MSATKWEYKVAYVEGWHRVSIEGQESGPEEHERDSGFARRFLNGLGAEGWELSEIQYARPGSAYYIFKRQLEDGAEPDMSVAKRESRSRQAPQEQPDSNADVASV